MIVATYSVHNDKPVIAPAARGLGPGRWQVRLYAHGETERHSDQIRNTQPCNLSDLLELAIQTHNEMLDELGWTVVDAGFQVLRLR
ncbi:hypothetical protein ACEK07_04535 [Alcanivoracaceae bacterium MT1]